jgi:hypothetical protein
MKHKVEHWWRVAVVMVLLHSSCSTHDPDRTRIGGPVPEYDGGDADSTVDPNAPLVTWCEALTVLRAKCHRCHQDPQLNGAPFSLLTYDDTQVISGSKKQPRWQRMKNAVETDFMPATFIKDLDPPVEPLTAEEKQTLLTWFAQGAQPLGGLDCP